MQYTICHESTGRMFEQEIRVGGAKIPGLVVESPKGVVNKDFGKQKEKEQTQNEAGMIMKEYMRRGRKEKRMRYLGDDTQEDKESEEEDGIMEGNSEYKERRIPGKGRKTKESETGKEGGITQKEDCKITQKEIKQPPPPQTFTELCMRKRKPSWPEGGGSKIRKKGEPPGKRENRKLNTGHL